MKTIDELATEVVEFEYEVRPYEMNDCYDSKEEAYNDFYNTIEKFVSFFYCDSKRVKPPPPDQFIFFAISPSSFPFICHKFKNVPKWNKNQKYFLYGFFTIPL